MNQRAVEQTCLSLLQLCNSFFKLAQIQANILKLGLQNNPLVLTKFISVSSGLNAIHYATSFVFSPESEPHLYDTFLFNTVFEAYAHTPHFKRAAISNYNKMLNLDIRPNNYTFPFVFKACAGIRDLNLGKSVHGSVSKLGLCDDMHVLNSMIHMYCSCEDGIEFAEKVFDEMPNTNSVSWSTMMGGYVKLGMPNEAVRLFTRMQGENVRPDEFTMVMVLSACADLGALELGKWLESYIERENIEMRPEVCNALIEMFAKCGDVDNALRLFKNMPHSKKNIVSWTCVISGMALNGRGLEAVSLFEEMKRGGVVPDGVAFIALLTACSHSGLIEKGKQYFDSMVNDYGIAPRIEHYGCMVDMLSRAGYVEQAMEFIDTMPISPNPVIWRTLIAACRAQGHPCLGERITKNLIMNEPADESNYVLLSNIYAKMLDWEKKSTVREEMGKKGIRKVPGNTMIELDDGIREMVDEMEKNCAS